MDKEISQAVIARLPRYFRYLGELKDSGVERISSQELSRLMHVTASQIRQDFNNFGGFGQQGYGYNVEYLYTEIGKILGLDKKHHLIIIGAGNLGQALANYMNFERRGFIFTGVFDINEKLHGKMIRGMKVRPMEEMQEFVRENNIDIAVLTIPKEARPPQLKSWWEWESRPYGISPMWIWMCLTAYRWKTYTCRTASSSCPI